MAGTTGLTDAQLVARVNELYDLARKQAARMKLIEETKPGFRNDSTWRDLERMKISYMIEANALMDSGQIPWIRDNGLGNVVDSIRDESVEVVARRVYNGFEAERDWNESDGRMIHLAVTSGRTHIHTLSFTRRETVQDVINQLQAEVAKWDNYEGPNNILI
ncbi:MAG: hypothetical protein GY906_10330 [bacterium]|nr:hypothetical protein [bacterium]